MPVVEIGDRAFLDGKLTNVVIPEGITSIGYGAFGKNHLTSVVIPDGVTSIGEAAFYENRLASVVIPDSVTSIGERAFAYNQLTSVVIPGGVASIENGAFYENRLASVVIPDSITSIGETAFGKNRLTGVVIPGGVTTIGFAAFAYNQLTNVTIGNGVTSLGEWAFAENPNLTSVTMPDSVAKLPNVDKNAFESTPFGRQTQTQRKEAEQTRLADLYQRAGNNLGNLGGTIYEYLFGGTRILFGNGTYTIRTGAMITETGNFKVSGDTVILASTDGKYSQYTIKGTTLEPGFARVM